MPKLDLTRAIRIKGAGGEINALKGQGFEWVKPSVITDPILAYFQATGADGAYYTPWDKSTLFQDAAGTIPVDDIGDPVGRISDVSGNNKHFKQTISSRRATWQGDHILFDGVDDYYRGDVGVFALDGRQIQLWCMLEHLAGKHQLVIGWPAHPTNHQSPWATHGMFLTLTQMNPQYVTSRAATTNNSGSPVAKILHRADSIEGHYYQNEVIRVSRAGTTNYAEPLPLLLGGNVAGGEVTAGKFFGAVVVIDANGVTGVDRDNITTEIAARGGLTL